MTIPGARALVVEDDRATRQAITAHLRREGFQVLETGNGLEALSLLRRGAVDIALVDAVLPEIDGDRARPPRPPGVDRADHHADRARTRGARGSPGSRPAPTTTSRGRSRWPR